MPPSLPEQAVAVLAVVFLVSLVPILASVWLCCGGVPLHLIGTSTATLAPHSAGSMQLPTTPGQAIYLDRHKSVVRDVAASGDGRYLVSIGDDGQFINYDLISGEMRMVGIYGDLADKTTLGLRSVAVPKVGQDAYVVGNPRSPAIFKVSLADIGYQPIPFTTTATTNKIAFWAGGSKLACIVGDKDYVVLDLEGKQIASAKIYPGKMFGAVGATAASTNGTVPGRYLFEHGAGGRRHEVGRAGAAQRVHRHRPGSLHLEVPRLCRFLVCPDGLGRRPDAAAGASFRETAAVGTQPRRHRVASRPAGGHSAWPLSGRHADAIRKAIWLATDRQLTAIDYKTKLIVALANLEIGKRLGPFAADPIEAIVAIPKSHFVAAALWDGRVAIVRPFEYVQPDDAAP